MAGFTGGSLLRFDGTSRDRLQEAFDNYPIVGLQSVFDHEAIADLRAAFDTTALDNILIIDDEQIFALLIEAERAARNRQSVTPLLSRYANAHEETG